MRRWLLWIFVFLVQYLRLLDAVEHAPVAAGVLVVHLPARSGHPVAAGVLVVHLPARSGHPVAAGVLVVHLPARSGHGPRLYGDEAMWWKRLGFEDAKLQYVGQME